MIRQLAQWLTISLHNPQWAKTGFPIGGHYVEIHSSNTGEGETASLNSTLITNAEDAPLMANA